MQEEIDLPWRELDSMPAEAKHAALADLLRLRRDSSAPRTHFHKESLQVGFQSWPNCAASGSACSFWRPFSFALTLVTALSPATQALEWHKRGLLLGAVLLTLCLATSCLRLHNHNLCGVLGAVCLICLAVLILLEMGVGDGATAETMGGVPRVMFSAVKSRVMWPDSVVKTAVSLSAALLLSVWICFASTTNIVPPPRAIAVRLQAIRDTIHTEARAGLCMLVSFVTKPQQVLMLSRDAMLGVGGRLCASA